jgi:hypothetical protein
VELIGIEVIEAAENGGQIPALDQSSAYRIRGTGRPRPRQETVVSHSAPCTFSLFRECATRDECLEQRLRVSVAAFEL